MDGGKRARAAELSWTRRIMSSIESHHSISPVDSVPPARARPPRRAPRR